MVGSRINVNVALLFSARIFITTSPIQLHCIRECQITTSVVRTAIATCLTYCFDFVLLRFGLRRWLRGYCETAADKKGDVVPVGIANW